MFNYTKIELLGKKCMIVLFLTIKLIYVQAQYIPKPVCISGKLTSDQDTIKIAGVYSPDYGVEGYENFNISLDENGEFRFKISDLRLPGRILLRDDFTNNYLFAFDQIIEPGDSIYILGEIHDLSNMSYFKAKFSGRGCEKYNCIQEIKSVKIPRDISQDTDLSRCIEKSNSILTVKLKVLDKYRLKLTPLVYQIIKADIYGELNNSVLFSNSMFGNRFGGILSGKRLNKLDLEKKKSDFKKFVINKNKQIVLPENFALSTVYINYLYNEAKCELALLKQGERFTFKEFYQFLRGNYRGTFQEMLLAYSILNNSDMYVFFGSCDADDYTNCLKDAVSRIHKSWLQSPIKSFLNSRGKGAEAFNFILPSDSSEHTIKLSDFKGKVILLDLWAYSCTGCYLFSNVFHEKVYPVFKNDSNFVVISIMIDESNKEAYLRRLRGEGGTIFTYSEYVNLFAGKGIRNGRAMETFYNIKSYPTLLLIGKNGKIFSSTLPYFNEAISPNVEELIRLIKNALIES